MDEELIAALDASFKRARGFKYLEGFGWVGDATATPCFSFWCLEAFIGKSVLDIPKALVKEEQGLRFFGPTRWECLKYILEGVLRG